VHVQVAAAVVYCMLVVYDVLVVVYAVRAELPIRDLLIQYNRDEFKAVSNTSATVAHCLKCIVAVPQYQSDAMRQR
jgi:hypothetical protein